MALIITDTEITSDEISARAEFRERAAADGSGAWVMSGIEGIGGRLFDRDQAVAAMTAAEERARICGHPGSRGGVCGLVPGHDGPHQLAHVVRGHSA